MPYHGWDSVCLIASKVSLNQVHYWQLVLSTAEPGLGLCKLPPHIQQVFSSLHDLLRKTLQGACWHCFYVWFLTQHAPAECCAIDCNLECNCSVCYRASYFILL